MNKFPEQLWTKSSYSHPDGQCVEVAMKSDAVGVRDTKNREAGHFAVSPTAWSAFVDRVKAGERDLPA